MICTVFAIFDGTDETQERAQQLRTLCAEGMVDIYSLAVVSKDPRGSVKVNQGGDYGCVGALVGVASGCVVGATAGAFIGWWVDRKIVGVTVEIVDIVSRHLSPGQSALVTQLDDESLRPHSRPA
jgi:uncharacterized membrane protein